MFRKTCNNIFQLESSARRVIWRRMATSSQDTSKASSDGASGSNKVSILAGETYDDKATPGEDHGDVSDEQKIATCIPKEAREAASDPEEALLQAIRDQRSEEDLGSYLNSTFEKIGDGADEAKNAKDGELEELGVSPGLARRGRVYDKALGEAKEGSAIEAFLLRTLDIDEQLATCLRAGTSCRKISCWAARYNLVNIAMALVRRNIAMALVGRKPDPLPEEVLAIAVEYRHVQLVERLTKLQHGLDVNRGRSDFPGAVGWTNSGAGTVPRRLTDDSHLNEYERHGSRFLVPICSAARMGNVEMVKTLSECDKITEVEWALHWAAIMGHHHVVLELLNSKREVDVNKPVYNMTYPILRDPYFTGSHAFNPLHIASFYGHVSVVKALCEDRLRRLRANTASEGGVTAVQMAAEMGHVQIVKILLERPEVEIAWALHGAAKKGHHDVVEELLNSEKEVDVNTPKQEILDDAQDRSSFGEEFNPLHLASIYGHAGVVQVLCEDRKRRLQVNIKSGAGMTALELAMEKGHVEIVKMLLERPEVQIRWALHGAAKKGHHNVVQELFNSGKEVDVNTLKQEILDDPQDRSSFGEEFNPLHLASIHGHASVVKVLCEDKKGRLQGNIESKPAGMTALQMATEKGHAEVVKMLLERPEVEIRWTLHKAAKKGHHNVVLELLNSRKEVFVNTLNHEILDDAQDGSSFGEEFNPLHLASIYGHVSVVKVLCEDKKGCLDVNTESARGMTAFQMAMEKGHVEAAKMLLERPEVETKLILHKAAKQGQHDVVDKLVEIGREMDVNTLVHLILDDPQDSLSFGKAFNPLHLASFYGHVKVVQALCKATTLRANTESGAGMTAVQIAKRRGHAEIEDFLLDRTDVQKHLDRLYRDRQVHVDAANAILVGATLIASVTFAAWLQPPLGYSEFYGSTSIDVGAPLPSGMYPSFVSVAGHPVLDIFWIFNSMTFLFAIATLMVGANAARPPKQDKDIGAVVRTLRTLLSLAYSLLTVSVGCVLGAFACAGFVVLPPVRRYTVTMGATLGIGLVVVSWTSSWIISSWISSKVLYALKVIKAYFATNP
jgi:ankyrin repeat protein